MPYGATTYEQYLKGYKKRKGGTRGALTRYAWNRYRQMQRQGAAPKDIDVAMGKIGMKPGFLTRDIRKGQKAQSWLINLLDRLRGG